MKVLLDYCKSWQDNERALGKVGHLLGKPSEIITEDAEHNKTKR